MPESGAAPAAVAAVEGAAAASKPPLDAAAAAAVAAAVPPSSGSLADYVIEKAIGRGHFSVVHRAVRRSDERRVALKKVQIFDMLDAKARDRCLKEVQLLKSLPPHPSIITYLDSFIDNNELYIVFEWAEHGDLRRLLRRANESKTSLQEPQVWRYFVQVSDGIRHMHEARIMHRDIKPANIFLSSDGSVKLGDLGLGRAFSSQTYEALSKGARDARIRLVGRHARAPRGRAQLSPTAQPDESSATTPICGARLRCAPPHADVRGCIAPSPPHRHSPAPSRAHTLRVHRLRRSWHAPIYVARGARRPRVRVEVGHLVARLPAL